MKYLCEQYYLQAFVTICLSVNGEISLIQYPYKSSAVVFLMFNVTLAERILVLMAVISTLFGYHEYFWCEHYIVIINQRDEK